MPQHFDPWFRTYAHVAHRAAARHAGAVVCVSETTAAEVRARWGIAAERLVIAPHGPGQQFPPLTPAGCSYFLYVGDDEPRKNVATLLRGYDRYRAARPTRWSSCTRRFTRASG